MSMFSRVLLAVAATIGWTAALAQDPARPDLVVAVVADGEYSRFSAVFEEIEAETRSLLGRRYNVEFRQEARPSGDWSAASVRSAVDRALGDPEVDIILALGVLASNDVGLRAELAKPVIAPFVLDAQLQGIPERVYQRRETGRGPEMVRSSGRENLTYVTFGLDFDEDARTFLEVTPFRHLAVLVMEPLVEAIPQFPTKIREVLAPLPLEVTVLPVGAEVGPAIASLPSEVEAVMVAPLAHVSAEEFAVLVRELNARKLPSYSIWGAAEVEQGLLAGMNLGQDVQRLARRIAVDIDSILLGDSAADLPVDLPRRRQLTLNMATAREIGVYPSFALLTEAELLAETRSEVSRRLSLSDVIREAEGANLDLAAAALTVSAGEQSVRNARSNLLPQLSVSGQTAFIDKDRAEASFGAQGRTQISGSATLSQLIYSEQARAGFDIERNLQQAREFDRQQLRLDVVLQAAQAHLNVLRAKTVERIQQDNLRVTRRNLELARSRVDLGAARRSELFRWESQLATNRIDVIAASAQRNQAEIELNRVLNRPLEESFATLEAGLDDASFTTGFEGLRPYVESRQHFRIFRRFMTEEAIDAAPELKVLDASLRARERALLAARRQFYVPTLGVQADVTGFDNYGTGEGLQLPPGPDGTSIEFPRANALNWTVGVSASLPIFQGGALRAQKTQAQIELDELTVMREAARQRVEQGIRSILHQAGSSFAAIALSQQSGDAARESFALVQDSYSEGLVDIVRLLDAQNQSLVADLIAANSIYDYLLDYAQTQRAVGRFDYFRSDEERESFLRRLGEYFSEQGLPVRQPN